VMWPGRPSLFRRLGFMLALTIPFSKASIRKFELEAMPTDEVFERTPAMKLEARSCVEAYGDKAARVLFLHNRKAGGTTVRKWLGEQQLCAKKFTAFVEESNVMNVSRLREPGTIFVTALREPLSRIVSSYNFEGEGSFAEWVLKVQNERAGGRKGRVWMEVQNYYVQRLSGYRWKGHGPSWDERGVGPTSDYPDWEALFHRALKVMNSFDVVFLVDEFHTPGTLEMGAAQMGIPTPSRHRLSHNTSSGSDNTRASTGSHQAAVSPTVKDVYYAGFGHARVARYTKGRAPGFNLSRVDEATLKAWNYWDTKLFEAAKERARSDKQSQGSSLPSSRRRLSVNRTPNPVAPPPLSSCAVNIHEKWCEPIARLRGRVSCHHLLHHNHQKGVG